MDRPRVYVDFNEMIEDNVVLLSQTDSKKGSGGNIVTFSEGMKVYVYSDDTDDEGNPDNLLAHETVERNRRTDWTSHVKWCCRIDMAVGIRHQSEIGN